MCRFSSLPQLLNQKLLGMRSKQSEMTLRFEEQGGASVVLSRSHPSHYARNFWSLKVFNTWRIAPASAGTVSHWASLKISPGVLSGARGYVCHEALWWVHCQSDGRWFSSKTLSYLLLSWITSGTYCHTLDSLEAGAKVKSGAHGVSQGSSPVSRRGYEKDWTEGFAELWVSPNKAPVNLVMTQGIAHSRWAAVAGPLCLCLAQYTPAIRWRRFARDADRSWRSRQLETAASTVHRGQQVLPWRVVWVTRHCLTEYPVILLILLSFSCPKLHACSVPPVLVLPEFLVPSIFTQRI